MTPELVQLEAALREIRAASPDGDGLGRALRCIVHIKQIAESALESIETAHDDNWRPAHFDKLADLSMEKHYRVRVGNHWLPLERQLIPMEGGRSYHSWRAKTNWTEGLSMVVLREYGCAIEEYVPK